MEMRDDKINDVKRHQTCEQQMHSFEKKNILNHDHQFFSGEVILKFKNLIFKICGWFISKWNNSEIR